MSINTSDSHPELSSVDRSASCTHSRMISDHVTETGHGSGKVRCLKCGHVVPDPHLKQEGEEV